MQIITLKGNFLINKTIVTEKEFWSEYLHDNTYSGRIHLVNILRLGIQKIPHDNTGA